VVIDWLFDNLPLCITDCYYPDLLITYSATKSFDSDNLWVRQNIPGGYVERNNRSTLVLTTVNGLPAKRKCVQEHCLASLFLLLLHRLIFLVRCCCFFLLALSCCTIYCVACTPRKLAFLAYLPLLAPSVVSLSCIIFCLSSQGFVVGERGFWC